jgi:hypothetical protein
MAAARCLLLEQILHLAGAPCELGAVVPGASFLDGTGERVFVLLRLGYTAQACSRSTSE